MRSQGLQAWHIITGIVSVFVLSVILGSFYTVDQTERAVVLKWGEFDRIGEPGLNWKAPFMEKAVVLSMQQQNERFNMVMYSKDQQPAATLVSVNYRLNPLEVAELYETYGADAELGAVVREYSHTDQRQLWKVLSRPFADIRDAERWCKYEKSMHLKKYPRSKREFFVIKMEHTA